MKCYFSGDRVWKPLTVPAAPSSSAPSASEASSSASPPVLSLFSSVPQTTPFSRSWKRFPLISVTPFSYASFCHLPFPARLSNKHLRKLLLFSFIHFLLTHWQCGVSSSYFSSPVPTNTLLITRCRDSFSVLLPPLSPRSLLTDVSFLKIASRVIELLELQQWKAQLVQPLHFTSGGKLRMKTVGGLAQQGAVV